MFKYPGPSELILAQAGNDFGFELGRLSPLSLNFAIVLAGIPVFLLACVAVRFFRPRVLQACLLLVPFPFIIAFFAVIDQLDRSANASGLAQALIMIILGIASSLPAYFVLARGIVMHVNEQNRR